MQFSKAPGGILGKLLCTLMLSIWVCCCGPVSAQPTRDPTGQQSTQQSRSVGGVTERFELRNSNSRDVSIAILSSDTLDIVNSDGATRTYNRLARYDTKDGAFVSYSSRELQQVVRWPVTGHGAIQIGRLEDGVIRFSQSNMRVHPLDARPSETNSRPNRTATLALDNDLLQLSDIRPFTLGVGDTSRQYLSAPSPNQLRLTTSNTGSSSTWYIKPQRDGLVQIQQNLDGRWYYLAPEFKSGSPQTRLGSNGFPNTRHFPGNRPGGSIGGIGRSNIHAIPLSLHGGFMGAGQLWYVHPYPGGGYVFESLLYPGMCLTFPPTGRIELVPINYTPWQIWYPLAPIVPAPMPVYETVSQQFVPNPPLPPVELELANSHQDELLVLLADRRKSKEPDRIRIPSGQSVTVPIERDAGGIIIESVSVADLLGNYRTEEYSFPVPPQVYYDLSVYEIFLQSIAIDRTGKSPNPIEDVNFQPRSIGMFLLPPGNEINESTKLDVYWAAKDQNNPGGVRRLRERDYNGNVQTKTPDPLKDILNQFQKQRAAF